MPSTNSARKADRRRRNPKNRDELLPEPLELRNASVSTSGDYERYVTIGKQRYGHIMNPKTGLPTQADYSVTVIAPSAMLADWLSTAVILGGEELARRQIAVRAGLHCAPLAHRTAGTLESGTIRISPSVFNTEGQINFFLREMREILRENTKKSV